MTIFSSFFTDPFSAIKKYNNDITATHSFVALALTAFFIAGCVGKLTPAFIITILSLLYISNIIYVAIIDWTAQA